VGVSVIGCDVFVGTDRGGDVAALVGSADGAGAHPPSAVETANKKGNTILTRPILFIATNLLKALQRDDADPGNQDCANCPTALSPGTAL
jgi:hypothetical protein